MRNKIFLAVLCGCLLMLYCAPNNLAGSTETRNNRVVGTLYLPDGKTPAAVVRVHIRPKKTLADTSMHKLSKFTVMDSVVTDNTGHFAFDTTLDTGTYVIEAASGNNAVLIDSVAVTSKESTDTLAPDTLKPVGALKGVISLSEGGDPRKVFLLAFGIDRFARVESNGSFRFQNLAEASYDLRIISSLDDYGVLDTVNIPVLSADTTNLDTISLPFTGIPTPKNVTIAYDTLKQIVTLTWSKADTALVKGYNVYRRNVDSNTVLSRINTTPITDTTYRDSTGIQDQTYEYKVVAVSKQDMEGTKSLGIGVTISPAYVLSKVIDLSSFTNRIYSATERLDGTFLILSGIDSDNPGLFLADTNGQILSVIDSIRTLQPEDVEIDKQGNAFVVDYTAKKIFAFSPQGDSIRQWNTSAGGTRLGMLDSLVHVLMYPYKIVTYTVFGDSVRTFSFQQYVYAVDESPQSDLYVLGERTLMKVDANDNTVDSLRDTDLSHLQTFNANRDLIVIDSISLAYILNKIIYITDLKGNLITRIIPPAGVLTYSICAGVNRNTLCIVDRNGKILKYTRTF